MWTTRLSNGASSGRDAAADLLSEPRESRHPRSLDRLARYAQGLCRFLDRKTGEYAALDDAKGAFVDLREALQREVDRQHLFDFRVSEERHVVLVIKGDGAVFAAAFDPRARPRVIDQDPPHRLGGDGEEAIAIGGGKLALPQKAKIDLMNEGGGRERVIGRLSPELSPRDVTKLVVHEGHELLERIAIACAPPRKTLGDLAGSHDVNRAGERPNHIAGAGSQPSSLIRAGDKVRRAPMRPPRASTRR